VLEGVDAAERPQVVRTLAALLAALRGEPPAGAEVAAAGDEAAAAVRPAQPGDWPQVARLLQEAALPLDGAEAALPGFFVAEAGGRLLGCAGCEPHGASALLRSVAVSRAAGGRGLAAALVVAALEAAAARGAQDAYLLTSTAADFFPRFGFRTLERDRLPEALQISPELRRACPSTAVAMGARLLRPLPWVRRAVAADVPAITDIYNQGIADRVATLEEAPHPVEERAAWLRERGPRHPVLAAVAGGRVRGWASLNPFNARAAYRHVADISVLRHRQPAALRARPPRPRPRLPQARAGRLPLQRRRHGALRQVRLPDGGNLPRAGDARRPLGRHHRHGAAAGADRCQLM
jgi:amino-acid N-acetyltransferase